MVLSKITPRETVVDACARSLRGAILSGEFSAGSRLPPERKLAELFNVNRVSVRSALGTLARDGLLKVRQGSGYVVCDFRRHAGPDILPSFAQWAQDQGALLPLVEDLLLVRRHLAQAVFERLASRKRLDTKPIAVAIEAFALAVSEEHNLEALAEADMTVLAAILEATGSAVLQLYYNPVRSVVGALPELRAALYAKPKANAVAYQLLLQWLERREPDGLTTILTALSEHDRQTMRRLKRSQSLGS